MQGKEHVRLEGTVKRMTHKAVLVALTSPKVKEIWIPSSQLKDTDCLAEGDEGYFVIPQWLAEKNDLLEDEEDDE